MAGSWLRVVVLSITARPALPMHLPALMPSGKSDNKTESDSEEESDSHVSKKMAECSSESDTDCSGAEFSDMN